MKSGRGRCVLQPIVELLFAIIRSDEEGFIQNGDLEYAVCILIAGGDAHLCDLSFIAGEGDSLLLLKLD